MDNWGLDAQLTGIKQQHLYRARQTVGSPQGTVLTIAGQQLVNFSSNDYLGLANHPDVVKAFQRASDEYGVGSGSAHLICGHSAEHQALEEELAEFTGRQRALLFSTGYMANLGVMSALVGSGDDVFQDKLNHASLIDAGQLSSARCRRYLHANTHRLVQLLERSTGNKKLIVTDGVFSMDGDEAPIEELVRLSEQSGAVLMVDDAHGLGVLGKTGGGLLQQHALTQQQVPILMGTFGKAFGTFGAFVAGSDALIETLIQRARTYIYTTAAPAALMAATRESLILVQKESWRREKVSDLAARFRAGAEQLGLNVQGSNSAIQPIVIGDSDKALAVSSRLKAKGFLVSAIREPTVPKGSARLRVTITATHTETQVDALLDAVSAAIKP
ncbi:MAG: 8-amino-7-oxononanoate synthase [Piscirickettsiaceae bacterium]|nr:MAG: 8-amino-7-oxononanoate synthase [Piscirickettsiaceae bacterium]